MGLDMYLTKREYVKNWEHTPEEKRTTVIVKRNGKKVISQLQVKELIYDVAYWRKANAIHQWFIDNVQDGDDDCKEYYVTADQLAELLALCKKVLATAKLKTGKIQNGSTMSKDGWKPILENGQLIENDEEIAMLLPTSSGFFFGSTDYDSYYLDDIKSTIEQLKPALEDQDGGDYYYSSSW